ncbi:Uncharacterised protein [Mycobacteroides abscessus subsp. abscessus]|nr:Uncharacterised protein [Mycobacteroides abscessus subsp. abscessus]
MPAGVPLAAGEPLATARTASMSLPRPSGARAMTACVSACEASSFAYAWSSPAIAERFVPSAAAFDSSRPM